MSKKISELPAAGAIADTDELELNQSGVSRKATRGQVIAGLASAAHQHDLADITDAGVLAALDTVGTAEIDAAAYASAAEAVAGTDNAKVMTALRTAQAIAAQTPSNHTHILADITDAGALAFLDAVGGGEILPNAVTTAKILNGAVDANKLANLAVVTSKLADGAVSSTKLEDGAATTAKLADAAVTEAKIAPTAYASHAEATAGTDNAKLMTPPAHRGGHWRAAAGPAPACARGHC